jgi:hypothetical protein
LLLFVVRHLHPPTPHHTSFTQNAVLANCGHHHHHPVFPAEQLRLENEQLRSALEWQKKEVNLSFFCPLCFEFPTPLIGLSFCLYGAMQQ